MEGCSVEWEFAQQPCMSQTKGKTERKVMPTCQQIPGYKETNYFAFQLKWPLYAFQGAEHGGLIFDALFHSCWVTRMMRHEMILDCSLIFLSCPKLNLFTEASICSFVFRKLCVKTAFFFLINRLASIVKTKIKINLLNDLQRAAAASVGTFSLQNCDLSPSSVEKQVILPRSWRYLQLYNRLASVSMEGGKYALHLT